jgi:hypothetical protein
MSLAATDLAAFGARDDAGLFDLGLDRLAKQFLHLQPPWFVG